MRLLAEFPRSKVVEIFQKSGHPDVVSQYFADILLYRWDEVSQALGLIGTTFKGVEGQTITIKKRSFMKDPENYSLPGYESYFKNSHLVDVDNSLYDKTQELAPRDWGSSVTLRSEGRHKTALVEGVKKGLFIKGKNLVQKAILGNFQLANNMGGSPFCKNRCFYSGNKAELIGLFFYVLLLKILRKIRVSRHTGW